MSISTAFDFDAIHDRRASDSTKWRYYGDEVLPMWVADMDFKSPPAILDALQARIEHGIFGYGHYPTQLAEIICERLYQLYHWSVIPDQILFLPGLVCGLNVICRAIGEIKTGVLVQTPVYPPFLLAPLYQERQLQSSPLIATRQQNYLYYEIDYEIFNNTITDNTKLFILCHPHNPVGRSYTPSELMQLAEICIRHDLIICSDEIHCDLLLDQRIHQPFATLSPEIAQRCITLMAPSKTFNIPGLGMSFAIVQNPALLKKLKRTTDGMIPHVNILGLIAAQAAYTQCDDWLTALRAYLTDNRNLLADYLMRYLPQLQATYPEATYLVWIDCRQAGISGNPHSFFLENAKLALNDGLTFGLGGEGFVRLNFGCPRATLLAGLERMQTALSHLK